jgi:hypothetical protein
VPAKELHRLTFQPEVHCPHRVELREGVDDLRQAKGLAPRAAALLVFRTEVNGGDPVFDVEIEKLRVVGMAVITPAATSASDGPARRLSTTILATLDASGSTFVCRFEIRRRPSLSAYDTSYVKVPAPFVSSAAPGPASALLSSPEIDPRSPQAETTSASAKTANVPHFIPPPPGMIRADR